ncbi:MAG: hypothetical protein V7642_3692 [Burkholderiales bacterium]
MLKPTESVSALSALTREVKLSCYWLEKISCPRLN